MKLTLFRFVLAGLIVGVMGIEGFTTETGTMMCKGGIVSIGDTAGEVISKCDQPATITEREQKVVEGGVKGSRDHTITTILVNDWIYNFGPNQFQYQLLLENGRVARIESLGYGY